MDTIILEPFVFFNFKINTFGKKVLIFYLYCMKEKILELRRLGKSYNEICSILNCAKSTVSYHCVKNNMGEDKEIISEEIIKKIKDLYVGCVTKKSISENLNLTEYIVDKYTKGLKRFSRFEEGLTKKQKQVILVTERRKKLKEMSIEYKGGKCEKCGYNKCNNALEFHHLDPKQKDFGIGQNGHTRSWERTKEELDKCIMVCANCHREIHSDLYND